MLDLSPIMGYVEGTLLAILMGMLIYGVKKAVDWLNSRGINLNFNMVNDFFEDQVRPRIKNRIKEFTGPIENIDDVPENFITDSVQFMIDNAPKILKASGMFDDNGDFSMVREFVISKIEQLFDEDSFF